MDLDGLETICYELRKDILTAIFNANFSGHPAGNFSLVEILVGLYYDGYLNTDPKKQDDPYRNVLIIGGSHSVAPLQYTILSRFGFIEREKVIYGFRSLEGTPGHPKIFVKGVESNEGSLGMAIPKAISFALAYKGRTVFALSSDSDFQEGETQEALAFAGKNLGSNFVYIVNSNGFSLDGRVKEDYKEKLGALGFTVIGRELDRSESIGDISGLCDTADGLFREEKLDYAINGNDMASVLKTYEKARELQSKTKKPIAIVFNTVKGAGHKEMAGNNNFHSRFPTGNSTSLLEDAIKGIITPGERYDFPQRQDSEVKRKKLIGNVLTDLASDYNFKILVADTGSSTGAIQFRDNFPDRYTDFGCREQLLISAAEGFALQGIDTISITFGQFLANRAREQIISLSQLYSTWNIVRISPKASTILIGTHNGLSSGKDDMSHHCINAYELANLPNMNVLHAADIAQLKSMLDYALRNKGLYYIAVEREEEIKAAERSAGLTLHDPNYQYKFGELEILREGDYATIIATGLRVYDSMKAALDLEKEGKNVRVVQIPTISRINEDQLARVLYGSKNVLVVEEQLEESGIGRQIESFMFRMGVSVNYQHLSIKDFSGSDSYSRLNSQNGLDALGIVNAIKIFR